MLRIASYKKVEVNQVFKSSSTKFSGWKIESRTIYKPKSIKFQPAQAIGNAIASQKLIEVQAFAMGQSWSLGRLSRPLTGWKLINEAAVSHVNSERHLGYRVQRRAAWRRRADINLETDMAIRVQTFQEVKSINLRVPDRDDGIHLLYSNQITDLVQHYAPGEINVKAILNAFLKNLKVYSEITSLTAAPVPNFSAVATKAEQQQIALEYEWTSPRFALRIVSSNDGNFWIERGKIALINSAGYPYRLHDVLDILTSNLAEEIGGQSQLAVQMIDVGYGFPQPTDTITVSGSVTEEIHLIQSALNVFV
ncbi:MAG: hypothetical protein F6K58_21880 [Symploca sp. SIO2E9]|nr:hypothetical protein [Symploca sp. SIO2E9]